VTSTHITYILTNENIKSNRKTRANALVFFIKRLESLPYYLSLLKAMIDLTNGGKEPNKSVMSANCKDFEIIIINMLTL